MELGELFAKDALERNESCGGHFREESTNCQEGEAQRDDENLQYVSAWEYTGEPSEATFTKKSWYMKILKLKTRSYK